MTELSNFLEWGSSRLPLKKSFFLIILVWARVQNMWKRWWLKCFHEWLLPVSFIIRLQLTKIGHKSKWERVAKMWERWWRQSHQFKCCSRCVLTHLYFLKTKQKLLLDKVTFSLPMFTNVNDIALEPTTLLERPGQNICEKWGSSVEMLQQMCSHPLSLSFVPTSSFLGT